MRKWWMDKTAYQIWPKSFYDSNGDGVGDLRGIIGKLDYLKDLGIDIVWLSPCFRTPFADQGYDISDYRSIDPLFGTMEDMDELIAGLRSRDMHLILDLVANHCSDEHPWFKEACRDPGGKYAKYFYIEKIRDGKLPNNWRSTFGGSCWEPLPGHPDRVYFHAYTKKQVDMNWRNPELRQELFDIVNWWLEKGVFGFRLDAIANICKPDIRQCFPADMDDGLVNMRTVLTHSEGPGEYLHMLRRAVFDPHDALAIGEMWADGNGTLSDVAGENGFLSTIFDFAPMTFRHYGNDGWYRSQPRLYGEEFKQVEFGRRGGIPADVFLTNVLENHDQPRAASHFMPGGPVSPEAKKMLGGISFLLPGLPFIYQGQEIGMENTRFCSIEDIDDCNTHHNYEIALEAGLSPEEALHRVSAFSRDNARTPMQWNASANAGFTSGTPWIPVNPDYTDINVADQTEKPDSVLNFYRSLTALRHDPAYRETIVFGDLVPCFEDRKDLMAFLRRTGAQQTLLVLANYRDGEQQITLRDAFRTVLNNYPELEEKKGHQVILKPYQFVILELRSGRI